MMRKAHQHHHNRWETSKEGLSSPWIGNFQRTSLCRSYEKEGRKEGRKGGDDESPGPIRFHPFTHSSMMRKAHVHNLLHLLTSFVSLHAALLLLPLLRLLFLQLQKITISSPSFFSLGGGDIFFCSSRRALSSVSAGWWLSPHLCKLLLFYL